MFYAAPAYAQATRTWVSGVGDDVNPCSRTAPCKTFAGAISKTAAGGEIDCLDPGGYGAVTITKSITIDCTGTFGSTLNSGTNGIVINDSLSASPNTSDVVLRGLSINGAGTTPGVNGIRFTSGRSLLVQDVFIQNQKGGNGISFQPAGAARMTLHDVTITNGGTGATGGGILIQPTGAGGSARVSIQDARVSGNANTALRIDSTGNTNATGITVSIVNSQFDENTNGIAVVNAVGTNPIAVMLTDSTVAANTGAGIITNGAGVQMRVGNTTITGNASGVTAVGGSTVNTYGNNRLIGNPTVGAANNGAFTGAAIPTQ
jgi:hypothetical protein